MKILDNTEKLILAVLTYRDAAYNEGWYAVDAANPRRNDKETKDQHFAWMKRRQAAEANVIRLISEVYVDMSKNQKSVLDVDVLSGLVNLIDAAADEHGNLAQVFDPEYQAVYREACKLLDRNPHEMLT